jgi:hypothetical protein
MTTKATSNSEPIRVSPWFPNAPKECSRVSSEFFDCFSKHTLSDKNEEVNNLAMAGLRKCVMEMNAYDKCMASHTSTHALRHYRVEEQYRK